MKKIILSVVVFVFVFSLSACGNESDTDIDITFSEYYQNAVDFEEIEPILCRYLSVIQTAYDNSDKETLNSFELCDEYSELVKSLSKLNNSSSVSLSDVLDGKVDADRYMARLKLLEPYLHIEVKIAERNLLLAANGNSVTKWFSELNQLLSDTYKEYQNGDGSN